MSGQATITTTAQPSVSLSDDGPLTCAKTQVTLTASSTTTGASYGFRGPGGAVNSSDGSTATVSQAGTYTVILTSNGCQATATTTVTGNTTPPPLTVTNNGPLTCAQPSVTLTASSTATGSYAFRGPGLSQTAAASTAADSVPPRQ